MIPPATPLRVLVVDDCPDTRRSFHMLLRLWGYDAREASDGPSALRLAADFLPDLVLLDIVLPGMDGCETARRLREAGLSPRPCLVAMTGRTDRVILADALEAGFDHFLVKPFQAVYLDALLRGFARARQQEDRPLPR